MVRQRKFLPSSPRSPLVLANSSSSSAASSTLKRKRDDDDDVDWETVVFRIEYDAPKGRKKPAAAKGKKKQKQKKGDTVTQGVQNDGYLVQSSPFKHGRLNDIRYRVEPGASWDEGRVYPTCTIPPDETIARGDYVYVRADDDNAAGAAVKGWVARILEIRAADAFNMRVRVYWMYRPDDLPNGRQPYHGENELIASNHMDVIEAQAIQSKANLEHWDEEADQDGPPNADLYWRQTYDVSTRRLSSLPKYCIDHAPCNPDQRLFQCPSPSCKKWSHGPCLEAAAVAQAYKSLGVEYPEEPNKPKKGPRPSKKTKPAKPIFTAALTPTDAQALAMRITNRLKKQTYEVGVKCLFCKEALDPELREGATTTADVPVPSAEADSEDGNDLEDAQAGSEESEEAAGDWNGNANTNGDDEAGSEDEDEDEDEDEAREPEPEPEPRSEDEAHAAIENALADVSEEEEVRPASRAAPQPPKPLPDVQRAASSQPLPVRPVRLAQPTQEDSSDSSDSSEDDDDEEEEEGWKPRTNGTGSSALTPSPNARTRAVPIPRTFPIGKTPQHSTATQRGATGTATKKVVATKNNNVVAVEQREAVSVTTTTGTETPGRDLNAGGLLSYIGRGIRKSFGADSSSE